MVHISSSDQGYGSSVTFGGLLAWFIQTDFSQAPISIRKPNGIVFRKYSETILGTTVWGQLCGCAIFDLN